MSDGKNRLIAYLGKKPVGIVDLIITSHTVEIDGLGVMEQYRHNAIGSSIQSHVGKLAKTKPVTLVADGEDTAKDIKKLSKVLCLECSTCDIFLSSSLTVSIMVRFLRRSLSESDTTAPGFHLDKRYLQCAYSGSDTACSFSTRR